MRLSALLSSSANLDRAAMKNKNQGIQAYLFSSAFLCLHQYHQLTAGKGSPHSKWMSSAVLRVFCRTPYVLHSGFFSSCQIGFRTACLQLRAALPFWKLSTRFALSPTHEIIGRPLDLQDTFGADQSGVTNIYPAFQKSLDKWRSQHNQLFLADFQFTKEDLLQFNGPEGGLRTQLFKKIFPNILELELSTAALLTTFSALFLWSQPSSCASSFAFNDGLVPQAWWVLLKKGPLALGLSVDHHFQKNPLKVGNFHIGTICLGCFIWVMGFCLGNFEVSTSNNHHVTIASLPG